MNIIVTGPQGSGKSTQAKMLANVLGYIHIATGEITRQISKENTDDGKMVKKIMDEGGLPPFEILFRRVKKILNDSSASGCIMDGYPREEDQIFMIEEYLKSKDQQIDKVFVLDLPDDEGIKRIMSRTKIEGRSDDTLEAIAKRLEIYHTQTKPIIDYYEKLGRVIYIDGKPSIEEVHKNIMEKLST